MPGPTLIAVTDPADPLLDDYRTLKDSQLRKRYENQLGVFIAEGPNVVRELVRSPYPVRSVLVTPDRRPSLADSLAGLETTVLEAPRALIEEVIRFRLHQGALAVGGRLPPVPPESVIRDARLVVFLEAMNDPENMGALFRSARALGAGAVLLGPHCADPLYRRCVRVSMGHVLRLPFAQVPTMERGLALLRDEGFTSLALHPGPGSRPLAEVRARSAGRVAVLLGAEGPGLEPDTLAAVDVRVHIPMRADVDSLNVTVAGAIALATLSGVV